MSPKIPYPLPNIDLSEIIVPGLEEAIAKAQITADNAQNAADAAQEFAESVFGELKALKDALGVYSEAGKLEAKINELEAMENTLNAKDEQFAELIKQLDEELESNISSLREEIFSLVVSKEEFPSMVEEQIRRAIEEDGGRINQAISDAIIEVTINLMTQIDDLRDSLKNVEAEIEDLTKRIETTEGEIDNLADRIQSLVFVPEYNDGRATVLSYTINNVPMSDNMIVTATFQVTPAALAGNVVNQYENVFVNVLPVLTHSSADIAYIASEENSSLVLRKGKRDGFVDIEVTVPTKTEDGIELAPGEFAISLYVASKEEVEAVVNGEETVVDMDTGTYTLHIKLRDEYYTLDEAAKMMSADVDDITPAFDCIVQYYDIHDSPAVDIAKYFNVERADPYGLNIDMAESDTMTDVVGSYVLATNTFAFGEDSRFGHKTVLENAGKYKVIDQPANIGITAGKE